MKKMFLLTLLFSIQALSADIITHPTCTLGIKMKTASFNAGEQKDLPILMGEPSLRLLHNKGYQQVLQEGIVENLNKAEEYISLIIYPMEKVSFFDLEKITAMHDFFTIKRFQTGRHLFALEARKRTETGSYDATTLIVNNKAQVRVELFEIKHKNNMFQIFIDPLLQKNIDEIPECVLDKN